MDLLLQVGWRQRCDVMRDSPDRLKRGRVGMQSGNHMPVDVRKLIAEEFVIDLLGLIDLRDNFGDEVHFLHQHNSFRGSQVK